MKFGDKVRFARQDEVHVDLRNKDFCLIGFDRTAYAVIDWQKRGQYNFNFYTGDVFTDLQQVPNVELRGAALLRRPSRAKG